MFDDMVNLFNLGAFSDEEKELLRTDFTYKKQMSRILKEARQDIVSFTPFFDPLEILKESHSLDKRHDIPNLLSEKYKLV